MNRKITPLLFTALILSCSKSETINYELNSDTPLQISVSDGISSKGIVVEEAADMGSVAIFCDYSGSEVWSDSSKFKKLDNRRYNYSEGDKWTIEGESESWGFKNVSDNYSFLAYSPHSSQCEEIVPQIVNGKLVIEYSLPTNSANQPDLMVALPTQNVHASNSAINLQFIHTLSSIGFSVVSARGLRIESISISGAICEGLLTWDYSHNQPCWDISKSVKKDVSVEIADYVIDRQNPTQVNTSRGYLMMIPQELTNGAEILVKLEDGTERSYTIAPKTLWKRGEQYHYTIGLDDENTFVFNSSEISNCYMIDGKASETALIHIPVQDRINDFWLNYAPRGKAKIDTTTNINKLRVEMLWEDFDGDVDFSGKLYRDSDNKVYAELLVTPETREGNLVFAVRKKDSAGDYMPLWSWHLWFTNYNPDKIAAERKQDIIIGKDTTYTLDDCEGALHRYSDSDSVDDSVAVWRGIYSDRFIMDRNIGQRNTPSLDGGAGSLYYQFGRKDPFPGSEYCYADNSSVGSRIKGSSDLDISVTYSDYFLRTSLSPYNWCGDSNARAAHFIWYDKDISAYNYKGGKSIFDPSPLGWMIPVSATWNKFNLTEKQIKKGKTINSVATFYKLGQRMAENGCELGEIGTSAYLWSANKPSGSYAFCYYACDTEITSSYENYASYALPIRAIQEID